jgi:molybdenum storage protein
MTGPTPYDAGAIRRGDRERLDIQSRFTAESHQRQDVIDATHTTHELQVYPDLNLVKLGGLSIIDRGRAAVFPLITEIIEARQQHQLMIGVGGGTRERHTYAIGLDLGLPTGGLAMIAGAIPEQNGTLIQTLLAKAGGIRIAKADFEKLPVYLRFGAIPIIVAIPPYHYWEHPAKVGRIAQHGGDTGMYLLAETFSARSCILVKDVDGLYTEDPKINPKADFIPRISAKELLALDLNDLPVERAVLDIMLRARNCKAVRIINGLVKGNLARALAGDEIGTVIHQ